MTVTLTPRRLAALQRQIELLDREAEYIHDLPPGEATEADLERLERLTRESDRMRAQLPSGY